MFGVCLSAQVTSYPPRNLHDHGFKELFAPPEAALALLRSALPAELVDAIEVDSIRPGPTGFTNDVLAEDHRDLLFEARLRGEGKVLFYVVEHQRTVERFMPLRLLRYVLGVWDWWRKTHPEERFLPIVVPLVLHQGSQAWSGPRSLAELMDLSSGLREALGGHVPALDMALEDLGPVSPEDLARFPGPPIVRVTLTVMKAVVEADGDPLAAFEWLGEALRELVAQPGGWVRFQTVLRYILMARPEIHSEQVEARLLQAAGVESREVLMTTAQEWIEQGVEKGIKKGQRELLIRLLGQRFGRLSEKHLARLEQATPDELQEWGDQLLGAQRIEEVFLSRPPEGEQRS